MKQRARLLVLLLGTALSQPALGAWSVTGLGANGNANNSSGTAATTASVTIPANALGLIGGIARRNSDTHTITVADSAGNSWTVLPVCTAVTGVTANVAYIAYYRYGGTGLTSGTITTTISSAWVAGAFSASYATGGQLSPVEDSGVRAFPGSPNGASTTPTITSGTPSASGELIFGVLARFASSAGFSHTADAGNGSVTLGATGNTNVVEGTWYAVNSGSSALTNTPTMNSGTWTQCVAGFFVDAPPASGRVNTQSLLGVK